MKIYRRFKKRHRVLHLLIAAIGIAMFWRGAWGILDTYFFPNNQLLSYVGSIFVAFLVLYFDDFHLKELA